MRFKTRQTTWLCRPKASAVVPTECASRCGGRYVFLISDVSGSPYSNASYRTWRCGCAWLRVSLSWFSSLSFQLVSIDTRRLRRQLTNNGYSCRNPLDGIRSRRTVRIHDDTEVDLHALISHLAGYEQYGRRAIGMELSTKEFLSRFSRSLSTVRCSTDCCRLYPLWQNVLVGAAVGRTKPLYVWRKATAFFSRIIKILWDTS